MYTDKNSSKTVTIAAGASLSGSSGDTKGRSVAGIITDAAWDTQAVTFQVSIDGTNYFNLYNAGTEYSLAAVVASSAHAVNPDVFAPFRYVKVRSGTAGLAANQVDASTVTLVLRPE